MNFFEHQDKANKKTKRLIFYFVIALVLIIAAINGVVYGTLHVVAQNNPVVEELYQYPIWLYITGALVVIMTLGTLFKMLQVASGGVSIAKMVNARPLNEGPQSFEEKQFINIVEEMSIASGTPVPQLFVMEDASINAFVAGKKPEDTVMVVTTGALNAFNRDEMQAVVGHEFSHIFNGDMKINLKLMGVLGGILALGVTGQTILRMMRYSGSSRRSSSNKGGGGVALAIFITGITLLVVGYIGLFFGRLIKAAVSRQRELLADACSVQFTRNPHGLASAFRVMQAHAAGTHLESKNVEDISHMCFGEAQWVMFGGLLATHPPLEARIKAIDPQDMYPILPRPSDKTKEEPKPKKKIGLETLMPMAAGAILHTSAEAVGASIAMPAQEHVEYAIAIVALIPEAVREAARDTHKVEALIYTLLLHEALKNKDTSFKGELSSEISQQVDRYQSLLASTEIPSLLPVLELSIQSYTSLPEDKRLKIYTTGLKLLEKVQAGPFHFAMLTILGNKLKAQSKKKPTVVKLDRVLKEITYLLAVLLSTSQQSKEAQAACFKKVMAQITGKSIKYPKIDTAHFEKLNKALKNLNLLTPLGKEQVIKACIKCVTDDGKVLVKEAELLRAVCEALDCPVPPIISTDES